MQISIIFLNYLYFVKLSGESYINIGFHLLFDI
jgi:hypothetical protein